MFCRSATGETEIVFPKLQKYQGRSNPLNSNFTESELICFLASCTVDQNSATSCVGTAHGLTSVRALKKGVNYSRGKRIRTGKRDHPLTARPRAITRSMSASLHSTQPAPPSG